MSSPKPVSSNSLRALPDGRLSFTCPHCAATLALTIEKAVEGPCPHCGGLIAIQPPREKLLPTPPRNNIAPAPLGRPPSPPSFPQSVASAPSRNSQAPARKAMLRKPMVGLLIALLILAGLLAYLLLRGTIQ